MPTLVHRFVLAGEEREVSLARRTVVDKVRAWGVPLDDETADAIRLVASELISNAVVHGEGPDTVTLYHRPGRMVIDVLDANPGCPTDELFPGRRRERTRPGTGRVSRFSVCLAAGRPGEARMGGDRASQGGARHPSRCSAQIIRATAEARRGGRA
ncbi:ATP-binding protein [Streptomyces sp. NPDC091383]|uniref:ATP-binding protein n=1 Tax=Streptomyces sp. NPDC091383 TaxID=3365996 RepID=UPI0037F5985E